MILSLTACSDKLEDKSENISFVGATLSDVDSIKEKYGATVEGVVTAEWRGDFRVVVEFYDENDVLVRRTSNIISGLSSGNSGKFKVVCPDGDVDYFKIISVQDVGF